MQTCNWRRWSLIAIASVLSALYLVMPGRADAQVSPPANEVRALWVVRNTLTSPEKIHQMVESAKTAGFNTLIVQVRGRGDAYYRSRWEPRANELKDQPAEFDPLAVTIAEAHQRGLKGSRLVEHQPARQPRRAALTIQIMSSTGILNGWQSRARSLPNSIR
jgi:uncharacterized lipoprotein YddW (UPF0748 family)